MLNRKLICLDSAKSTELPSPKSELPPGRPDCLPLEVGRWRGGKGEISSELFSERAPYCVGVVGRVTGWSRSADATSDVRTYLTASFWFQLDISDVRTRRRPRVDESDRG